jgi:hypothetical protein
MSGVVEESLGGVIKWGMREAEDCLKYLGAITYSKKFPLTFPCFPSVSFKLMLLL